MHGLTYLTTSASQRKSQEPGGRVWIPLLSFHSCHCPSLLLPPPVPPLCLYSIWCHQLYLSHGSLFTCAHEFCGVCPGLCSSLLSWQHHCITFSGLELALTSQSNITHNLPRSLPCPIVQMKQDRGDHGGEGGKQTRQCSWRRGKHDLVGDQRRVSRNNSREQMLTYNPWELEWQVAKVFWIVCLLSFFRQAWAFMLSWYGEFSLRVREALIIGSLSRSLCNDLGLISF